ncbi:uncharacterized protein HKW66_Vig0227730 [Vigna angularis]|uniref:Uncharacterized protein n=1 Tax=Phaseolus angularis TaxID=3914 RepID=A0A8T0KAN8_PHAAN|nr:uncharacterized protein HKW66_Vig0227730 [Vigna angularis]
MRIRWVLEGIRRYPGAWGSHKLSILNDDGSGGGRMCGLRRLVCEIRSNPKLHSRTTRESAQERNHHFLSFTMSVMSNREKIDFLGTNGPLKNSLENPAINHPNRELHRQRDNPCCRRAKLRGHHILHPAENHNEIQKNLKSKKPAACLHRPP